MVSFSLGGTIPFLLSFLNLVKMQIPLDESKKENFLFY